MDTKRSLDFFRGMQRLFLKILAFSAVICGATTLSAESGESVVVVYNSSVPQSKAVAEHYANLRHVPENQVIGFELPETETMTRGAFRSDLQKPLFKYLEKQKLIVVRLDSMPVGTNSVAGTFWRVKESKIRYIVLCYGVPSRILPEPNLRESGVENIQPALRQNGAAVDSELSLLPMLDAKLPLTGFTPNPFYGTTNAADLNPLNGLFLVSRLDGPTPEIAKGLVDKAIQAEKNGLWGRAYFDMRGLTNGEFLPGDKMLVQSAKAASEFGFETVVDNQPQTFSAGFPMSQIGLYAGWYDGTVSGPFTRPQVEFMPGAFAYHLHSYSAATVRSTNQNWVGPLLAKGAAATIGYVDEPYLALTLDIPAFVSRFTFLGFSYGEAAYAAQMGLSWQTTVIGDPLYRPFAKKPQALHEQLAAEKSPLLEWSHLRVANLNLVKGFPADEVISYLEDAGKNSAVLTEKLGDLQFEKGKVWSAISSYTQALDLNPSPEQDIRLTLKLAEKLEAEKKDAEALGMYKLLLKNHPDYPDAAALAQSMNRISARLGKPVETAPAQTELQKVSAEIKK